MSGRVNNRNNDRISARVLLLDLFTTGQRDTLSSNQIRAIGEAFGLSDLALRTALTRLRAEGKLSVVSRGVYARGTIADPIRDRAASWWKHPLRRVSWDQSWIGGIIKPTTLTRTKWRRTQWALEFNGFRQDDSGLWLRPNNLVGGSEQMALDLLAFGADETMLIARMDGISSLHADRFSNLWDLDKLARVHDEAVRMLQLSLNVMGDGVDAAVETLLVGREAIRRILRDPLLPPEICDNESLDRLVECMIAYDKLGRAAWADFIDEIS